MTQPLPTANPAPHAIHASIAGSGEMVVLHASADPTVPAREVQRLHLGGAPMPMAFNPDRTRLYVVDRSPAFRVHTLAVDPHEGLLTELGVAPLAGNMAYASTTRDGRFLLSASYGDDFVAVNPIDSEGIALGPVQRVPTPKHAHAILPDPTEDSVWITCLGADLVLNLELQPDTGMLDDSPRWTLTCRPGSGPRHAVFHPDAPWCFVINELDGSIDTFALPEHPTSPPRLVATASLMADGFTQAPQSAEIRLSHDGQWLFASERRTGTVVSLRIERGSGKLAVMHRLEVDVTPRSFAVAPDDTRLHVVSQQSGQLTTVHVDQASGQMRVAHVQALGASPTWVETLALVPR